MFRRIRFGVLLLSLIVVAAGALAGEPPLLLRDKLNADQAAGKMSLDDATMLRIVALTHYGLLPEEYRLPVGRCGTELALDLARDLDRAHPEVQAVARYLAAPVRDRKQMKKPAIKAAKVERKAMADEAVQAATVTIAATATLSSPHFVIEFDPAQVTVGYVTEINIALEDAYNAMAGFGFPAPLNGNVIDVRIAVPTFFPSDVWGAALNLIGYASLYIHPDLGSFTSTNNDPAGDVSGRIKSVAAHEVFHLVQYQIASFPTMLSNYWMLEGQATAMEEEVFPFVDEYLSLLSGSSGFYNNTDRPIDQLDYESVLFHRLIIERYGAGNPIILQDILADLPVFGGAFSAIENRLDLNEVMKWFARWNFFSGARSNIPGYADAAQFPTFTQFRQPVHFMSTSVPTVPETLLLMSPVSSRYIQIRPATSLTSPKKLTVKVTSGSIGEIRGWIVVRRQNGTTDIIDLGFAPGATNEKTVTVANFSASTVGEVVIILANGHPGMPELLATYSVELEKPLDIGFLVDTTGSMWDDIAAVRASAAAILTRLQSSGNDFRMAVTDYKDFPIYPYGGSGDYPYRADSPFSNSASVINGGLNMLNASGGGDWPESLWSGVMGTINGQGIGPWRANAKKAIVIMTDAPPHEPEPFTGYNLMSVMAAANAGGITFGDPTLRFRPSTEQEAVVNAATANGIRVYSVIVGGDYSAQYYLQQLADGTGGKVFTAYSATDVVDALLAALDEASTGGGGGGGEEPPPSGNRAPDVTGATATPSTFWPPDNKMAEVQIAGVTDPDGDSVTIEITAILQDEPVNGENQGNREPDGSGVGTSTASIRAERDGDGNGRMYRIEFTATDGRGGSSTGSVLVCVPHDQGNNSSCIDEGQSFDSTIP